jgi:hypothetical protein
LNKNACFDSLQIFSERLLIVRRSELDMIKKIYIGFHVKYRYYYYFHTLLKNESFRHIFEKCSNMKFHENPSNGIRVVPCGRKDGQRTDMTKLTVAFRNFANAPKTNRTTPCRQIMAVCCKNNMERIITLREKCRVFGVKPGGTNSYH